MDKLIQEFTTGMNSKVKQGFITTKIKPSSIVKGFDTKAEMEQFILDEVRKASIRHTFNNGTDASDLESYLMIRVWTSVMNNPTYQNERGVRMIIKHRVTNFFNSPTNYNSDVDLFSTLTSSDNEGSETSFEEKYVASSTPFEDSLIERESGQGFLGTLCVEHRKILALKVDGYNIKDICEIVYPNMAYESSRKKVKRAMDKITELALDFGLED